MDIISLTRNPEHSRQIAAWYYDEWVNPLSEKTVDDVHKEIIERLDLGQDIPNYFIALEHGTLVGVVELKYRESRRHPEFVHWLGGLYVKNENRHKGIGSRLIESNKTYAIKLGVTDLYLQCEHRLTGYYLRHGFVVCDRGMLGCEETMIMVCKLAQANRI